MSGISCPMPKVVTYRDTRDAYNAARKKFPDLPGVSGHRREAARALGLDYKTFMDIFTKRVPDSSSVTPRLVAKKAVEKSPRVKAPKSMYREVVGENNFGQPNLEMFWGRKKIGEVTTVEQDFGGFTTTKYVGRIGNKTEAFTSADNLDEVRSIIASRAAFDMDVKKQIDELLARLAATGDVDISDLTKLDRNLAFNSTAKADAGARASMSMEHQKIVFDELDRQMPLSGNYAHDYFHGMHRYDGSDEIAHYKTFEHTMTVNPTYGKMTVNRLDELHLGGERNLFYTQTASTEYGGGMKSVIAHEYGHHVQSVIDNYIAVTKMPDISAVHATAEAIADHIEQFIRWRVEIEAARRLASSMYAEIQAIILRDMNIRYPSMYDRANRTRRQWEAAMPSGSGSLDGLLRNMVQSETPIRSGSRMFPANLGAGKPAFHVDDNWARYVSYYGGTNHAEFMAEVWAEYSRNRAVRPHIREMGVAIQITLSKLERLRKLITS